MESPIPALKRHCSGEQVPGSSHHFSQILGSAKSIRLNVVINLLLIMEVIQKKEKKYNLKKNIGIHGIQIKKTQEKHQTNEHYGKILRIH
jgi:hypothetical protein